MHRPTLSATLLGYPDITRLTSAGPPLKPSTPVAFFIEKGHIMEVLDIGHPEKRVVALFFGPGEIAVRCHPLSGLQSLDNVQGNSFTHGMLMTTLRKFPESHVYYREMRQRYQEKVAARLNSLQNMTGQQRYEQLAATQPWVLKLAEPADIASYLGISLEVLNKIRK